MDGDQVTLLTLEQDFELRNFTDLVQRMSHEQTQKLLIEQHRLMLAQKTIYQELLKHAWKLDLDVVLP